MQITSSLRAAIPSTGGIDALSVRVPRTVRFTEAFHRKYSDIRQTEVPKPPDAQYQRRIDLRPYSVSAILHDHRRFRPSGEHKLELVNVGNMSAHQIRTEIREVFDGDADALEIMRVDLFADVTDIPVQWFHTHSFVKRKQVMHEYNAVTNSETLQHLELKSGLRTLMLGAGADLFRIYDKAGLWRQEHEKAIKIAKQNCIELPASPMPSGHDFSANVTRIERQLRGRRVPNELSTLGLLLQNAAEYDPFSTFVMLPAGMPDPHPDHYSMNEYLRGIGARSEIEKVGMAVFRAWINRKSKNNAAKLFKQIRDFLPVNADGFSAPNLTDLYHCGVDRQLSCSDSEASDPLACGYTAEQKAA